VARAPHALAHEPDHLPLALRRDDRLQRGGSRRDWVHVAGTTAVDGDGEIVGGDDPAAQTRETLRKIAEALHDLGATLDDVVRTRVYLTDAADWEAVGREHGAAFAEARPAAAMLVTGLLDPRMRVEIEAVAYVGGA
jgi:enamine deaminase RidA (YjgF/YER057c/UK114 family)